MWHLRGVRKNGRVYWRLGKDLIWCCFFTRDTLVLICRLVAFTSQDPSFWRCSRILQYLSIKTVSLIRYQNPTLISQGQSQEGISPALSTTPPSKSATHSTTSLQAKDHYHSFTPSNLLPTPELRLKFKRQVNKQAQRLRLQLRSTITGKVPFLEEYLPRIWVSPLVSVRACILGLLWKA